MRVVSGEARGIPLKSVPGDTTRPILDRVKTALFDILRPVISGTRVLDLFAGSGSVGIEALSQGAGFCLFLDIEKKAVATIKANLMATKLAGRADVRQADAFAFLKACQESFDLIYVAPPQYKGVWIEALHAISERPELVTPNGQIAVQIDPHEYEQLELAEFEELKQRKYGSTLLIFYGRKR